MQNESGLRPVEFKVVIKPDPIEEKTSGGIIMPDESHERQQWAQVKGTLIAKGGKAFGDPFTPEEAEQLQPGARVYFAKYQGITFIGADGDEYKLCQDKDVGGIVENEAAVPIHAIKGRDRKGLDVA